MPSDWMAAAVLLPITFGMVFLRAIQQLNVVHSHYRAAILTSYAMAAAEIGLVTGIVAVGWAAVPWVGTGGAVGVVSAMRLYRWMRSRGEWEKPQ